jgi:hypothetical protein
MSLAIENHVIDLAPEVIEPAATELTADTRSEQSQPSRIASWAAGPLGEALAPLHHTDLPGLSLDGLAGVRPRKRLDIPNGAQ